MKHPKLTLALLVSVVTLVTTGCGGTTVDAKIGGTVVGLSGGTTVGLANNGTDPISVAASGSFSFDVQIASGSTYDVTVQTNPIGETCTVANGTGTVDSNGDPITSVVVTCDAVQ